MTCDVWGLFEVILCFHIFLTYVTFVITKSPFHASTGVLRPLERPRMASTGTLGSRITDQELRIGTLWEKHDLRSKFCKSILHCVLPVLSSLRPGCPIKGTPCFNTYSLLVSGTRMTILHRLTKYWGSLVEKRGRGLNLLNATQLVWILGKVLDCTQLGKVSAVEASWWHVGAWEAAREHKWWRRENSLSSPACSCRKLLPAHQENN